MSLHDYTNGVGIFNIYETIYNEQLKDFQLTSLWNDVEN